MPIGPGGNTRPDFVGATLSQARLRRVDRPHKRRGVASATPLSAPARLRPSARRRLAAGALSTGLVALLLFALLRLGVLPAQPRAPSRPNSFTLSPSPEPEAPRARKVAAKRAAQAVTRPAPAPTPPRPPVPKPAPPAPLLALSKSDFAATDIGRLAGAGEEDGADTADSVAAYGPGEGPGGERLYPAEWYREPPASALALYLPGGPRPGWATVACRTVAAYHVDNCRELEESPRGSGLARAVRQAAWQFLVRPPRLGGKPLVGAWVRIHYTFTEQGAEHAP